MAVWVQSRGAIAQAIRSDPKYGGVAPNSGEVVWPCVKNTGILHTACPAETWANFGILAESCWPSVAKHGESAVFYRDLGRELCARILAESFFVTGAGTGWANAGLSQQVQGESMASLGP